MKFKFLPHFKVIFIFFPVAGLSSLVCILCLDKAGSSNRISSFRNRCTSSRPSDSIDSMHQLDPVLQKDSRHDGALFKKFTCTASCPTISHKATVGWAWGACLLVSQYVSGDRLVSWKVLLLMSYHSLSQSGTCNLSLSSHLDAFFFFF